VFIPTTHVVAAPRGFACLGIPATWLYIPSFIEIRSGALEPQGVKTIKSESKKKAKVAKKYMLEMYGFYMFNVITGMK